MDSTLVRDLEENNRVSDTVLLVGWFMRDIGVDGVSGGVLGDSDDAERRDRPDEATCIGSKLAGCLGAFSGLDGALTGIRGPGEAVRESRYTGE